MANWLNSDFQISAFIAGKCHTPDEAYRQLQQLREDRVRALNHAEVAGIRQKAKLAKAKSTLANESSTESEKLDAEADILEIELNEELNINCWKAAKHEVEFIDACIAKVQPLRKFNHIQDDDMAAQAVQQEEWKYELIERAKDFLLTTGTIPHDHYRAMRNHPEYLEILEPTISDIAALVHKGRASLINPTPVLEIEQAPLAKLLASGELKELLMIEPPINEKEPA